MKFRAKISKENLVALHSIVLTLERLASTAAIFLNEESVRISLISESIDAPRCYAELSAHNLFLEYRIESQSSNTILFEIVLAQLSKALASGKVASQSQLKLVKRDNVACLCFETKADESIMAVDVCHDIPIKLMKSTEVVHFLPPQMPPPSVALDLPRGKLMKTIIDKMTKFAKHVQVTATQSGRIALKAEHSSVTINTYYSGLQARYVGQLTPRDVNNQVSAKLNLRRLAVVLNTGNIPVDFSTLYFSANEGVMMLINLSPGRLGTLSYYIPVLLLDDEEGGDDDAEV
ncbi:checkpoint protein Hus1/Mec3 [Ochromonadaceae sp. CCMP2298]|nr:checkpoint protein Hus1/Mec3 [Ochromonadaceae sp. CCMP2298]|mmetsp:Transcript_16984/g.37109  ORF Transcript_16984/g.37109 Transcript_16984/m.37109 type:complete len:290 (+) Transcript_16984:42-911(+)